MWKSRNHFMGKLLYNIQVVAVVWAVLVVAVVFVVLSVSVEEAAFLIVLFNLKFFF